MLLADFATRALAGASAPRAGGGYLVGCARHIWDVYRAIYAFSPEVKASPRLYSGGTCSYGIFSRFS